MTRIIVGGDLCPLGCNAAAFERGDAGNLFHDLLEDFAKADLVIANLECPLIERPTPIAKTGPVFGAAPLSIEGIRAAGIHMLALANNHILDHGAQGLETTLATCARAGISTVGAGMNLAAARRIVVARAGDVRVGVLAMAEHEFSIARSDAPGANPLDVMDYVRNVSGARGTFDYLVVLVHAGLEFLAAPSPRLKDTCHFLAEMGANAVIVQHPHSFGGYETYGGAHIVYGQGALVMDEAIYRNRESFHDGILVALTVAAGGTSSMELLPFVQSVPLPGARRMDSGRAAAFLLELDAKASAILDDGYVRREWLRECEREKHAYVSVLLAHNRLLRLANRRGHVTRLLFNRRRLLGTRNVVCCETHREALETIFDEGLI